MNQTATPQVYAPNDRVKFRVFLEGAEKPIRRGGVVIGPDPDAPEHVLVLGDRTNEDKRADRPGEIFSVWPVPGAGLVTGSAAPQAAADIDPGIVSTEAGGSARPGLGAAIDRYAIVHRGPHTEQVTDILASLFGAPGREIALRRLARADGTVIYGFSASERAAEEIAAKIEAHHDAAPILGLTEATPEEMNKLAESDGDWPVLG